MARSRTNMRWGIRIFTLVMMIGAMAAAGLGRELSDSAADEGVLSRLSEARSLLQKENVALQKGVVAVRHVRVSRRRFKDVAVMGITGREIALALLDAEGKFHIVRGLKRDNKGFETLTPGYALSLRREN